MWNTTQPHPEAAVPVSPGEAAGDQQPHDEQQEQPLLLLVGLHSTLLLVGVAGNAVVCACVCAQQTARMRNHLLLNLCAADMLVCALSGSLAAAPPALLASACRAAAFLQSAPVAASTLSLAVLSVDRYASVQHPRLLTQLRHRRHLTALLVAGSWCGALLAAALACAASCGGGWPPALGVCRVLVVWLAPVAVVGACHVAVGRKLCEVSLTAAAARGELPLPMPVIRRRRNVIIVAGVGVASEGPSKVIPFHCGDSQSSSDEELALQICADLDELRRQEPPPRRPQHRLRRLPPCRGRGRARSASRSEGAIVRANRRLRPLAVPPLVKAGGGQSPAARRRLARLLYLQAGVFALCWLPHAACELCALLAGNSSPAVRQTAQSLLYFTLVLGHAHSALHPLLYWLLNRQSPQLQGCAPFHWPHLGRSTRPGRRRLGLFSLAGRGPRRRRHPPPSSTNEAALGVFHPRYTVPRPQERQRFPTSHFLP